MASCSTNQNSCITNNKKNSCQVLPNDIILEIFSWLPTKSICRFKCCSKFFSKFTENKYFLKQQSDNSLLKDDTCFFIQRMCFTNMYAPESALKIHDLHKQNASSSCGVHPRFFEFLALTDVEIKTSSNGLLFCRVHSELFVCNPTTLSCSYVPSPICIERFMYGYVHPNYVFECDSEEFKLFAFSDRFDGSFECSIYDPKRDVWNVRKELFFVGDWYKMEFEFPVFYRGIIHVLSEWEDWLPPNRHDDLVPYIATYDVESGISRILRIPYIDPTVPDVIARIFKWGKRESSHESICLVKLENLCFFSIWILSDYEGKRWSSPRHVNLEEMGTAKEDLLVVDFIVMNGECLVFATKTNVYRYDLVGEREGRLEEVCGHEPKSDMMISLIPYSSTLRSCAKPLPTRNIGYEEESEYNFRCDSEYCREDLG